MNLHLLQEGMEMDIVMQGSQFQSGKRDSCTPSEIIPAAATLPMINWEPGKDRGSQPCLSLWTLLEV